eukprot:10709018-Alexandrium_andersonii.AAC.1
MSASLVGSEMCIRDRAARRELRFPRRAAGRVRDAPPAGPRYAAGQAPVSYTHLTLPTICSV